MNKNSIYAARSLVLAGLFGSCTFASAATQAFLAGGNGTQNFGGTVGHTFVVTGTDALEVTSLGAFDHMGDGLSSSIIVNLWEATGTTTDGAAGPYEMLSQTGTDIFAFSGVLLASLTINPGDGTSGGTSGFIYKALAGGTITLTPDRAYVISASGYNATDLFRNIGAGGGISSVNAPILIGANGYQTEANVLPEFGDGYHSEVGGVGGKYAAASFEFNVVPEPTAGLLGGLGALFFLRRRRTQS